MELSKTNGRLPTAAANPSSAPLSTSSPGQRRVSNGSALTSRVPSERGTTALGSPINAMGQMASPSGAVPLEFTHPDQEAIASRKRKQSDASIYSQPTGPPPSLAAPIAGPSAPIPPSMPPRKRKKKEADPFMPVKVRSCTLVCIAMPDLFLHL